MLNRNWISRSRFLFLIDSASGCIDLHTQCAVSVFTFVKWGMIFTFFVEELRAAHQQLDLLRLGARSRSLSFFILPRFFIFIFSSFSLPNAISWGSSIKDVQEKFEFFDTFSLSLKIVYSHVLKFMLCPKSTDLFPLTVGHLLWKIPWYPISCPAHGLFNTRHLSSVPSILNAKCIFFISYCANVTMKRTDFIRSLVQKAPRKTRILPL